MIQQLQKKILDQQERLAVAVKVDRAKDAAINKLREAWLRLTGNLDKAEERHRQALEKMVREVENFRMVADDAQKVLLTTSLPVGSDVLITAVFGSLQGSMGNCVVLVDLILIY